ncbi:MAG: FAD-dependent oxidoreductase [Desulfobacteraceae bacterium]
MNPVGKRYVIVGASAAGMAAAQTIRGCDPFGAITVLSAEADAPYFRPMIPFIISRAKTDRQISLQGQGPYQASGIDLRLHTRAEKIEPAGQTISADTGEVIPYDRLLIATGSTPYIPTDIEGCEADGVFALRTIEDARRASLRAGDIDHAVMLGGGLLNLKAAFALLERGLKVTLIVSSPEVLSQLMEPQDAYLIRAALNNAGLEIRTGCIARKIVADSNGVSGLILDDGSEMACQMVCIGKGVRPNADFAVNAAIDVDGGVVVNPFTRTSVDHIYAAGDAAVTFDPITGDRMVTGLWTNAVEMGRCAGANMAGRPTVYVGTFGILNATQVARMPFVSMGIVHTAGSTYEIHTRSGAGFYRKLVFATGGDRLIGALFVGDIAGAGLYRLVIRERMAVDDIKRHLIDHKLHYGHLICRHIPDRAES